MLDGTTWTSSDPRVLSISQNDGTAIAKGEGRAEVMLSNAINAASIVHVSKVQGAELDSMASTDLVLNVDDPSDILRPRVKLYLKNQVEELMPVTQFDGLNLIRQNVALKCETDQPKILEAQAEVSEIEGYICNIKFVGHKVSHKDIPKKIKVMVSVGGQRKDSKGKKEALYSQEVLNFEVKMVGSLFVEKSYKRGISFGQYSRSKSISVLSLSEFEVTSSSKDLKIRKSRDPAYPNQHNITVVVPKSVTSKLTADINLENLATGEVTSIPLKFDPADTRQKPKETEA